MSNRLKATETVIEDFGTVGDWSASGGTAEVVTSPAKSSGALKLTGGVGTYCFATKTISRSFLTDPNLKVWVYIPVLADITGIEIKLASDAGLTTYFSKSYSTTYLHEGWNRIILRKTDFTATGVVGWSDTMVKLRVRVNSAAGAAGIAIFDELSHGRDRSAVIVCFDDGWDSQYTYGFNYMRALGLKGTVYLPGSVVGTTNYLSESQANEMYAQGWDFCNHTLTHTNLTTYSTQAEMVADIKAGRDRLISMGFTRNNCHLHLAYPQGGYNEQARNAAVESGCLTARTVKDSVQSVEVEEPTLLYRMGVYDTTSLATAKAHIDRAIGGGASIFLNFHKIVAGVAGASTEWNESDFNNLMKYLAAKRDGNQCDVLTVGEWYRQCKSRRKEA